MLFFCFFENLIHFFLHFTLEFLCVFPPGAVAGIRSIRRGAGSLSQRRGVGSETGGAATSAQSKAGHSHLTLLLNQVPCTRNLSHTSWTLHTSHIAEKKKKQAHIVSW